MFGPFSPGDSLRVYRLQRRGLSLDLEQGLTQPHVPLREAWLALVTQQAMGCPTYVLYDPQNGEAFVQVRYRPHQAAADVVFLSPSLADSQRVCQAWSYLLEGVGIEMAGHGIQRLFASLPESGAEVDIFHQSGFTAYAREDIFRLAQPAPRPAGQAPAGLRSQRADDWPALQKLCVAIVPQRVRQLEGGITGALGLSRQQQSYIVPGNNQPGTDHEEGIRAALYLRSGPLSHQIRILVSPEACELVDSLIVWGLATLGVQPTKPVYCSVRHYETGVREPLQAAGFELHHTRTLMVKQTIAWVKPATQELVPALKGSAEPLPPAYRIHHECSQQPAAGPKH